LAKVVLPAPFGPAMITTFCSTAMRRRVCQIAKHPRSLSPAAGGVEHSTSAPRCQLHARHKRLSASRRRPAATWTAQIAGRIRPTAGRRRRDAARRLGVCTRYISCCGAQTRVCRAQTAGCCRGAWRMRCADGRLRAAYRRMRLADAENAPCNSMCSGAQTAVCGLHHGI
jgi:hypothetical protein